MTLTRALARPMLAGIFVWGGIDALRNPEGKAKKAQDVAPLAEQLHLPTQDPVTLVRINGAVQLAGGTLLALGRMPRLASMALVGSLVPTTYAGHRFWEETDDANRQQQRIHFLKNMAVLGGLILAAVDTEGRPSVSWRARRDLKRAAQVTKGASKVARGAPAVAGLATLNLTKQAIKATEKAGRKATKESKGLGKTAHSLSRQVAEGAREHLNDGSMDRLRQSASGLAGQAAGLAGQAAGVASSVAERARDALPLAG